LNRQLVVDYGIGQLVQTALFEGTSMDAGPSCCRINPTEAGGVDQAQQGDTRRWAGSPVLSQIHTATTSTVVVQPLNFLHDIGATNLGLKTDAFSPLLWKGTLRKTVTVGRLPGVIEIKAEAQFPGTPRLYNFQNIFFLYDLPAAYYELLNTTTGLVTRQGSDGSSTSPNIAVIASNADRTLAVGIYRRPLSSMIGIGYNHKVGGGLNLGANAWHSIGAAWETEDIVFAVGPTDKVEANLLSMSK
jgi:hypothetical protein